MTSIIGLHTSIPSDEDMEIAPLNLKLSLEGKISI